MTNDEMIKIARENIERNLGNVCTGDDPPDTIYEETYVLGFDALVDKGVDRHTAHDVAQGIAKSMVPS